MKTIVVENKGLVRIEWNDPSHDGIKPQIQTIPIERSDIVVIIRPWDLVKDEEESVCMTA